MIGKYPIISNVETLETHPDEDDEETKEFKKGKIKFMQRVDINELHDDPVMKAINNKDRKVMNKLNR